MESKVLTVLARNHSDWLNMARSFKISDDEANELVQEMYLRVSSYVNDVEKIMYNETEVNTFYIYVALRNLHLSNFHKMQNNKMSKNTSTFSEFINNEIDNIEFEDKFNDITDSKTKFDKLIDKIDNLVDDWYWYDKKLFNIYFYDDMSMRELSKATKISLSSIFNTISNAKENIRKSAKKEYEDYKKSKGSL